MARSSASASDSETVGVTRGETRVSATEWEVVSCAAAAIGRHATSAMRPTQRFMDGALYGMDVTGA